MNRVPLLKGKKNCSLGLPSVVRDDKEEQLARYGKVMQLLFYKIDI
jgi:hypothetical protein